MLNRMIISAVILCFVPVICVQAQEKTPDKPVDYLSLGVVTAFSTSPYIDDDSRVIPIPLVSYITERFYFTGLETGYALMGDRQLSLIATANARMEYYDEDDSYIFDGMANRHASLDGGLKVRWEHPWCGLETGFRADLLSVYDGYEIFARAKKSFKGVFEIEKLKVDISAGLSWRSDELNDYYFGVRPSEATADRPVYEPQGDLNYQLGCGWSYKLSDKWSLFNNYRVEFLADEIADSPLVDTDTTFSVMVGLAYQFDLSK
ncbi:MAG: MipA/OmpV family protein [Sedimentisphaerales bacterium]|nr:MipA/OmpV family protein [Sedimentisphaerales bacterium]